MSIIRSTASGAFRVVILFCVYFENIVTFFDLLNVFEVEFLASAEYVFLNMKTALLSLSASIWYVFAGIPEWRVVCEYKMDNSNSVFSSLNHHLAPGACRRFLE